ncbi:MAG: cobalamin B12-binding domain-containing protein [Bacillota bacterium]
MSEQLVKAIADVKEDEALTIVKKMLADGEDPIKILRKCRKGVEIIGDRYESGDYFMPELIMAGEILTAISDLTRNRIEANQDEEEFLGKILLGTVEGDIHDIGKNIVSFMLEINGFEVIDLGVDVPAADFIQAIKDETPDIVGMSALLTLAFDQMKATIEAIEEAGLRDKVKIIIGGAPINEKIREHTKADGWAKDAVEAVNMSKTWVGVS